MLVKIITSLSASDGKLWPLACNVRGTDLARRSLHATNEKSRTPNQEPRAHRLPLGQIRHLVAALARRGTVFALTRAGSRVTLAPVPEGGRVRLATGPPALGPERHVMPPADALFGVRRQPMQMSAPTGPVVLFAVPPCVVYSIRFLDTLLASGPFLDSRHAARRTGALLVAMNCTTQKSGCYCRQLGIGPRLRSSQDADIVLTPAGSAFLLESGSPAGASVLSNLRLAAARTE